jgi:hypothetical protein
MKRKNRRPRVLFVGRSVPMLLLRTTILGTAWRMYPSSMPWERHDEMNLVNFKKQLHVIPNILIFTYKTNLLTANITDLSTMEKVFLNNTFDTISLHPNSTVRFLDDADCLAAIQEVYSADTNMTGHFMAEQEGMYRGDICRGAALYQTGGIYFDMDVVARMSMWDVIEKDVDFVVPKEPVKPDPERRAFYQAFVAATPRHPIVRTYLDLFEGFYNKRVPRPIHLLGVHFMKDAYYQSGYDQSRTRLWTAMTYNDKLLPYVEPPKSRQPGCSDVVIAQPEPPTAYNPSVDPKLIVPLDTNVYGSQRCPLPEARREKYEKMLNAMNPEQREKLELLVAEGQRRTELRKKLIAAGFKPGPGLDRALSRILEAKRKVENPSASKPSSKLG